MKTPTVAIVGRPNVGKSTIFNYLAKERISIVLDEPNVTRDRIYTKVSWLNHYFSLIDTGGIELSDAPFLVEVQAQVEIAIEEADVILFIVDGQHDLTNDDHIVAKMLYQSNKPIIVVCNKLDANHLDNNKFNFYELGFEHVFGVSSNHGRGFGDMLDTVVSLFPAKQEEIEDDSIKFALIGRPNVGKSSLVNSILQEDRVIVSEIAGTTRDAIDVDFNAYDQKFTVVDTAGVRKKGKVYEKTEKYSVLRTLMAIDKCSLTLCVINAEEGIIEQDKKVIGYAYEAKKAMIIIVNKWDAVNKTDKSMKLFEDEIREHFKFIPYVPILFVSALTKTRISSIIPKIIEINANYHKRIQTSLVNEVIAQATAYKQAPNFNGGRFRVYYGSQVATTPPTFAFFVNNKDFLHFSYERFLENELRSSFDFEGVPLKLLYRNRE